LGSLTLTTDKFGEETSWELKDVGTGEIVKSGGNYRSERTVTESFGCLDINACYQFTIYDAFGDGICCGEFGDGDYSLEFNGEVTPGNGGFGSSETIAGLGNCVNRRLSDIVFVEHLNVHTKITRDISHVVEMTISVPYDQHVTVEIVDANSGIILHSLFDGTISIDAGAVVSFDIGDDIGTLKYKALVQGEIENIELDLYKRGYISN
jgi:hypothetical protein